MDDLSRMMGTDVDIPQITLRRIDTLMAYANNARTHSPAQVEQIMASLMNFGWTNPVLVDEMGTVAGHGRTMGASELYRLGKQIKFPNGSPIPIGMVPVIDCSGWSDAQRKAYILADNKLALNAGWDEELLGAELRALNDVGYDLDVIGFSEEELADLMALPPEAPPPSDPDAAPPLPFEPDSRLGDTWVLGPHRVHCGDSTNPGDWELLMQGERADACWTDPPYNVDLGRKNRLLDKTLGGDRSETGSIANDKMTDEDFNELITKAYVALHQVLKPGATVYVAHSDKAGGVFRNRFEEAGFHFSQMLIWAKNNIVLGMADFQPKHEPILYGWKAGSKHRWYGGRKQTTIIETGEGGLISPLPDGKWQIKIGDNVLIVDGQATLQESPSTIFNEPKPDRSDLHASQKPVNLIERMLKNSTRAGDIVVDGFGGSGSTLIAADRLGMCARLMELSPAFTDVIVKRWQDYTGRRAVHAVTGELFPGDDEERLPDGEMPSGPPVDVF